MRSLFTNRAYRLAVFFTIACLIYLPLSLFFPVWIAILGPIIYGVPHILSSLRYSQFKSSPSIKGIFISLWISVTALRILIDLDYWNPGIYYSPFDIEILSVIVSILLFSVFAGRRGIALAKGILLTAALVSAAWFAPIELTAFLLLFHNAVAFIYWIAASKRKADLIVSITATAVFLLISTGILLGSFDFLFSYITPQGFVARFNMDYADLGKFMAPWSEDYQVWFRFFVAYVFGQSLHYFVWLKAIPEQHLKEEYPVSFRASYKWLEKDFSKYALPVLACVLLAGIGYWLFFNLHEARIIYFAIASYHGFHELAGLPFLQRKSG